MILSKFSETVDKIKFQSMPIPVDTRRTLFSF